MLIQTINGRFSFPVYRFQTIQGSSNYLRLSGQFTQGHYQSKALCAYALAYAGELSYASVSKLIQERSGNSQLSDQYIHSLAKAEQVGLSQQAPMAKYAPVALIRRSGLIGCHCERTLLDGRWGKCGQTEKQKRQDS